MAKRESWVKAEEALLEELARRGFTDSEISEVFLARGYNRSKNSIAKKRLRIYMKRLYNLK